MEKRPILAIDFDGTITKDNDFPNLGPLMPGAKKVLNELHDRGCIIILWTCRCGEHLEAAKGYMERAGIPYDHVNENIPEIQGQYAWPKVFANYYIDDLNLGGFPGWRAVREIVLKDAYFKPKRKPRKKE